MEKIVVLCGGGTAGHVYPALAVAEKLDGYKLHYIGGNGMEKEILKDKPQFIYHEIPTVKLERTFTLKNLLIPIKLLKSVRETKKILKEIKPQVIFSKGGFVSVPVAIAGKSLKIPIISHESDLSMGLANKIIMHFCTFMCTTFAETGKGNKKCIHTGQPIRSKILDGKKLDLNFNNNKPTVLVLGGSLGAQFLNNLIFDNIDTLTKKYNIIHICGKKNYQKINKQNYFLTAYAENIEDYYKSCDVVISRAGSGVINELLVLEKPMLLVPLSKKCSRGDQIENAKLFSQLGYGLTLEEEKCNINTLEQKLENLIKNKENFIKNIKKTAKNDAVSKIVELIKKY